MNASPLRNMRQYRGKDMAVGQTHSRQGGQIRPLIRVIAVEIRKTAKGQIIEREELWEEFRPWEEFRTLFRVPRRFIQDF